MSDKAKLSDKIGAVLVVGGGIGGIQSALDLADSGFKVYLLDESPSIGGVMTQLDKTFPTNDCSMCILAPKLVTAGRHQNIEILSCSEVVSVDGQAGHFTVKVTRKALYINEETCTGCGVCLRECPTRAIDAYNEGLSLRSSAYIKFPQAVPLVAVIDRDSCIGCGICKYVCPADAVEYDQRDEESTLEVGAIILSPGFKEFDPSVKTEYGYGRCTNVVTSTEFERMLSASGPYQGTFVRPSDGEIPKKIAFIQCVGSRDKQIEKEYCSSVCCMYATKEAVIAKEHASIVEPTIFFLDIRAYGKDFDKYVTKAEEEHGVRFIRSRVSSIDEVPKTKNLVVEYASEDGELNKEEFDLVVLSVGLSQPEGAEKLAKNFGVKLNKDGFCDTDEFSPVKTTKEGIFVCGAFQGPKDIPGSVIQASGAAGEVSSLLSASRDTLVEKKEYPPEIDVAGQEPRIGVFVCRCGINISAYVDVPSVAEYAKGLPNVVYVEDNLFTCSQDTQQKIKEKIKEQKLNRVIVASCTPRTHESLFRETVREAGLNPYLFEMANIRDQCSWIHMQDPQGATKKAKDLVRMAVAKASLIEPLPKIQSEVVPRGLVIGGGLAGMVAALGIAEQGFEVYLIEKERELGGNLRDLYYTLAGKDAQDLLKKLIARVEKEDLIHVYTEAEIKSVEGSVGKFKTTIGSGEVEMELEHGIVIVATGAQEYRSDEYLYGTDERVITQRELEDRIANHPGKVKNYEKIVMIQCVGSRDDERPYCSRVCCSEAIKNALKVKGINEKSEVYVLYRDIRTYGFKEEYYNKAGEAGVLFIRYDEDKKPVVSNEGGKLTVSVLDPTLNETIQIEPDVLVLSVATVPGNDNEKLSELLKVSLNEDNFFLEAHVKLRPVEFATDGIFLCGLAHSPKFIDESISQAKAAVSKACSILSKPFIEVEGIIAHVDEEKCSGCGTCKSVCEYNAIEIETIVEDGKEIRRAKITEALCKGCGSCAAACPSGAIDQKGFTTEEIYAMIDSALEEGG